MMYLVGGWSRPCGSDTLMFPLNSSQHLPANHRYGGVSGSLSHAIVGYIQGYGPIFATKMDRPATNNIERFVRWTYQGKALAVYWLAYLSQDVLE